MKELLREMPILFNENEFQTKKKNAVKTFEINIKE